uniref:Putative ovule protein n=1 Tax=Solanum chacoense TaxID=4108 RepID=A0A0V0H255_SOLCH
MCIFLLFDLLEEVFFSYRRVGRDSFSLLEPRLYEEKKRVLFTFSLAVFVSIGHCGMFLCVVKIKN